MVITDPQTAASFPTTRPLHASATSFVPPPQIINLLREADLITSFDWVFSPRSKSGAPMPMFDRVTGDVNPTVVAYWHDHYDLAHLTEEHWATNGPLLKGRIHLIVGTADTFYLDGAAHKFEAVLNRLGAEPHFTYLPDRTHFDLYMAGSDRTALFDQISSEMYAVARPGSHWQPSPTAPATPDK